MSEQSEGPKQTPSLPAVVTSSQDTLSGADVRALVETGLGKWGEVVVQQMADKDKEREHRLERDKLEYAHIARENDAERGIQERSDRRALIFAAAIIALLAAVSVALVFSGHGDIAGQVVKDVFIFAGGLGVGQTRPVRALLGPRQRTSERTGDADDDESD